MKRRITSLLVALSMVFSAMPFFVLETFSSVAYADDSPSGSGTVDDPFKIGSVTELEWFRDNINSGTIAIGSCADLTNDIDLKNAEWTPIVSYNSGKLYSGTFDGRNHTISNFKITNADSGAYGYGLFGFTGNSLLKNIHIKNVTFGTSSISIGGGGLVGENRGDVVIRNCSVENCKIYDASTASGLLVGHSRIGSLKIYDCWTTGDAYSSVTSALGGILGSDNLNGEPLVFYRCHSSASLNANRPGGIIGIARQQTTVQDCYYDGTTITARNGGGTLIGFVTNSSTVAINTSFGYMTGKSNPAYVGNVDSNSSVKYSGHLRLGSTTDAQFLQKETFTNVGYDFDGVEGKTPSPVWTMGTLHPIFAQRVDDSSKNRTLTLYDTETKKYNLTDYFDLVSPENGNYNQDGRFDFTFPDGSKEFKTTVNVWDGEENDFIDKEITVATISDDTLTLNGAVGEGEYGPFYITATDSVSNGYDTFNFDLTAVVKQYVPVPEIQIDSFPFSRNMFLDSVTLTEGWEWLSPTTTPRTGRYEYEAYYKYDEDAKYYDTSLLTAANVSFIEVTDESGTVTGIKVKIPVTTLESSETPHSKTLVVTSADTGNPVSGAYISTEYEDEFDGHGHQTGPDGTLVASLSQGAREITVSAAGYVTLTDTYTVDALNNQRIEIALTPVRYDEFFTPVVYEKNADGTLTDTAIENATVTITKVDSTAAEAWNGGNVSKTVAANSQTTVPEGVFMIKNATRGYSGDDVVYANVVMDNGGGERPVTFAVTYYDSYNPTTRTFGNEKDYKLYAKKLTDARYDLLIDEPKGSGQYYTAKLSLSNLKATIGTFGIRWDPDLFELVDVEGNGVYAELKNNLKKVTDSTFLGESLAADRARGYYVLTWQTEEGEELDAETTAQDIAEFKFKLIGSKDLITYDSFGIEPFDETVEAKAYLKTLDPDEDSRYWEFWRYCDKENNPDSLGVNRIEASKAVVNEIDTKGFFQAAKNAELGAGNPADFVDVMTVLTYDFTINNAVLKFHTYDSVTEEDIEKTTIKVFDVTNVLKMFGATKTNYAGRASFPVNIKSAKTSTFAYTAAIDGYWPVPLSGFTEDRPRVDVKTGRVTEVPVPLEKKIYHTPVLKQTREGETVEEGEQPTTAQLELVTEADLGGEKYAYNGRDYHFRVKAAKGYRITKYPTEAFVYVNDVLLADLSHDTDGQFTLYKSYLDYSKNENLRDLTEEDYNKILAGDDAADYSGWTYETDQPNSDGYRGYNLVIRFDQFEVEELEYFVEGVTNSNGHVTYNPDIPAGSLAASVVQDEYVMIKTLNKDNGGPKHLTGTFTFTGDTDDDVVDKVFINGLEVDTYNDLHEFTYSFDDVDMDNNITVLFRNGDTPSTDKVMTLVVGEFGFADVSSPVKDSEDSDYNDVMLTRRVYLNPTSNLVFDAHAMIGYELKAVEKEVDGADRVDITSSSISTETKQETIKNSENEDVPVDVTHTTYSIDTPAENQQNITVYVTFGAPGIDSPNLFVKSFVAFGKGTVDPAGILIYNKWDSVEIDLQADKPEENGEPWLVTSVKVSEYYDVDDADKVSVYEYEKPYSDHQLYRYDSLRTDMAFGAVFMEKAYTLKGYVDLDQGSQNILGDVKSGAIVKFVRLKDGKEIPKQPLFITATIAQRNSAEFEIELPIGDWDVYVTKAGCLRYVITNFTFEKPAADDTVSWFGGDSSETATHVIPYIGSTIDGPKISLTDAANVKSGWRQGVSQTVHDMADVTDDETVDRKDLSFVLFNFNKRQITQPYSDFKSGIIPTVAYTEN